MKRRRIALFALFALFASLLVPAVAACGRYGKPVRSSPAPPHPEEAVQGATEEEAGGTTDAQSPAKR